MIKFNNKKLPDFIKITGFSFSVLPAITHKESTVPHLIGNYDGGIKRGSATYSFDFVLKYASDKSVFEMAKEFKEWAKGENYLPSPLIFLDNTEYYTLARVDTSIELKDMFTHGEGSFSMVASNPIKYSVEDFVAESTTGTLIVDYKGAEEASTVFTIKVLSNCQNLSIKQTNTLRISSLLGNFKSGQTITIDSGKKVVTVDNVVSMLSVDLEHDWLYLEEGLNEFTVKSNTTGSNLNLSIKYKNEQ